jgi:methyl-accepting chemotaxis protein
MRFQDLRISAKLGAAFSALILASAISSAVIFTSLQKIDESSISSQRSLSLMAQAEAIMTQVIEQQNAVRGYAVLGEPRLADNYANAKSAFDGQLDAFEAKTTQAAQKARIQKLRTAMADWRRDIGEPAMHLGGDPATRAQAAELAGRKA